MKKSLVISAHLDDAVLSTGQFLAGHSNCDVLTVFAGIPMNEPGRDGEPFITDYDLNCGFETSKDAMVVRRQEDAEALALLNANPIHTDLLDIQYGGNPGQDFAEFIRSYNLDEYEMIIGPLGLLHPDHIELSDSLISLDLPNLYLYEDLPHRVTHPQEVFYRLQEIGLTPLNEPVFIGDGPIQDKVRALWCYRSQIGRGDLNPYNLYVPERFWKICKSSI